MAYKSGPGGQRASVGTGGSGAAISGGGTSGRGTGSGSGSSKQKSKTSSGLLGMLGLDDINLTPSGPGGPQTQNPQGAGAPAVRPEPAPALPQIPDSAPAEPQPDQDLSPLAEAPKRKALRSSLGSFNGSAGITGYAGVFIP